MRWILPLLAVAACQRTDKAAAGAVDCARVGDILANFELGNDATPETRSPIVAKHRAACEAQHVTGDQQACLLKAKDTWAARACLPTMFAAPANPNEKPSCSVVVERMRAAITSELRTVGSAAEQQMQKVLPVVQQSCEQDGWPMRVLQCITATKIGDMETFQRCVQQLPDDMQQKMAERMTAMQQQK